MPTRPADDVLGQVRQLRAALDGLAAALERRDQPSVLESEPLLQAVVRLSPVPDAVSAEARQAAVAELAGVRAALARCRALGAANAELTSVTLDVLGRTGPYSRHGAGRPRDPRGRDLHARV